MKKYIIYSIGKNFETIRKFETDNPDTALKKWIRYSSKYPLNTAISCKYNKDVVALYKLFLKDINYYRTLWAEFKVPYRFSYMYDGVSRSLRSPIDSIFGDKDFYDQVPYFSLG